MSPKKILGAIRDHNLDMQERLFRLLLTIGLTGLAIGILGGTLAGESIENIVSMTIAFVVIFMITVAAVKTRRIQLGASIIGAIVVYGVLPYNFFTTGGINGGAPIWMLFGVVYVCLVVKGKIRKFFLATGYILYAVCYYLNYTHPVTVVPHTYPMAFIDRSPDLMAHTRKEFILCLI